MVVQAPLESPANTGIVEGDCRMNKQDSAAWELNDLLGKDGIDPKTVLVLRHRPTERQFRKVLPWLAAERPDTYNAYQQVQGPTVNLSSGST